MCIAVLIVGCRPKIELKGVENRRFHRDLVKLREILLECLREDEYREKEINEIMNKMNKYDYKKKLNSIEIVLLENLNDSLDDLKYDLSDEDNAIMTSTYNKLNWLLQLLTLPMTKVRGFSGD